MSSPIVQPSAFNAAKLVISAPKPSKAGGKMAFIGYGESRNLVLQTPSLRTPFGVKDSTKGEYARPGPAKFSLDLDLRGHEENPKVKALHDAIQSMDDFVFKQAEQNCKLWFGKVRSHDALLEAFTRSVKTSQGKDGTPYPPRMKISLKKKLDTEEASHASENFDCPVYDQASRSDPNAKPLEGVDIEELLSKGSEMTTLLQASMIWIVNDRFGISWKAKQISVDVPGQGGSSSGGYGFVDDDEDAPRPSGRANTGGGGAAFQEPAEFSAPAQRAMTPAPKPLAFEEDEDEEVAPAAAPQRQLVEEEDDDEVAPPPVPKKTVVTKKTVQTKLVTKAK